MKISEHWLREWINPSLNTTELTEQMAMLGLTVDAVIPVAGKFSNVVVGFIISAVQHPNADKLRCCEVSVGGDQPLKIVCGAPNARAGIKVAVAMVGAVLPDDFKIKETKLRGELSQGMICSAKELQLQLGNTTQEGIIELPEDAIIGTDFNAYFQANDHIFDIEITPNRGDCFSVRGLSRDIAAALSVGVGVSVSASKRVNATCDATVPVLISAPSDCPRYVGRVIRTINNTKQSPSWLQQRLQRASISLINPVVDVCNYVMLELGQPMHAFDLSKIKNAIHVRRGKQNETVELLDDSTITVTPDDLVIADDHEVHALAGIMGGKKSGICADTTVVFLEAAFFCPKTVCLSKRRHNINTDSSHRFERGVDFNLPVDAIERATNMLLAMVGGEASEIIEVISKEQLPARDKIILKKNQIERMLGIDISDEKVERILKSLGMNVHSHSHSHSHSHYEVTPPSFRFDITLPIDLIEELARMTHYDSIPAVPMHGLLMMHPKKEGRVCDKMVRRFLVSRAYHEAMTYSFISPELHQLFSPTVTPMTLQNPLSRDLSAMRVSICPGLMQALQMNVRHQSERVRLFEMGLCFLSQENGELLQEAKLAMAITGHVVPEQWDQKTRAVNFYDLKADVDALLSLSHQSNDYYHWKAQIHPALHPGRSIALYSHSHLIGWLGELHPALMNHFDIREPVILCELSLKKIQESAVPKLKAFSRFPTLRRDLSIVLSETVTAEKLKSVVFEKAGESLQDVCIFDVYQGKNIEADKKSVAVGLTFQHPDRTLCDEEINEIMQSIISTLQQTLGAVLRT